MRPPPRGDQNRRAWTHLDGPQPTFWAVREFCPGRTATDSGVLPPGVPLGAKPRKL